MLLQVQCRIPVLKLNDCPFPIIPESKTPSFEVTVCLPSSFIHVTVSPTLTSTGFGLNELLPALATIFTTVELLGMDVAVGCCIEFPDPSTPIFMLPDRKYVATIAPAITTDAINTAFFLTMARVI